MAEKISIHLAKMLSKLPQDEEFTIDELSPAYIYRAQWVLNTLVSKGYLTQRIEWINPNWQQEGDYRTMSFYRVIKIRED